MIPVPTHTIILRLCVLISVFRPLRTSSRGPVDALNVYNDDRIFGNQRRLLRDVDSSSKSSTEKLTEGEHVGYRINLTMPGAKPAEDDAYLCSSFKIDGDTRRRYVTGFSVDATADKVHHLILQTCTDPPRQPGEIWDCRHHNVCNAGTRILYAWAKDAPPLKLPESIGFVVGDVRNDHFILQVHYAHPLPVEQYTTLTLDINENKLSYQAGIYLLWSGNDLLPPNQTYVHSDNTCMLRGLKAPLTAFAYRTHAHQLAVVITGYRQRNGELMEIARGDPQKPQVFYKMPERVELRNGDYVTNRCTYNTTSRSTSTRMGSTAGDEMCNLYIMFYTSSFEEDKFLACTGEEDGGKISSHLPHDSDHLQKDTAIQKESPLAYDNGVAPSRPIYDVKKSFSSGDNNWVYSADSSWPSKEADTLFGQVCSVSLDIYGNPVVFHRGDRIWDGSTFKSDNVYSGNQNEPIAQDTVVTLNPKNGSIINSWGANLFFLPHMLTIDYQNNVWLTDVAMHQVFKFSAYGGDTKRPLVVLGQRFRPGNDDHHYCKPTSVAVLSDGKTFFVSDGYCNSRIIKYQLHIDAQGYHNITKVMEWGHPNSAGVIGGVPKSPYNLNVPHGLALAEDKGLLFVADRENGRVQCYDISSGYFVKTIKLKEFGSTIYSVDYLSAQGGLLYAVGGPEPFGLFRGKTTQGYIIDVDRMSLISTFNSDFQTPHDLAVSDNGSHLYVVEIKPFKVWRMMRGVSANNGEVIDAKQDGNSGEGEQTSMVSDTIMKIVKVVPKSRIGLVVAISSLVLTILCSCCIIYTRCRKRGKGKVRSSNVDGRIDLGDLLGRSKEGFQPLKMDDDVDAISSDSDVEDFSVPSFNT